MCLHVWAVAVFSALHISSHIMLSNQQYTGCQKRMSIHEPICYRTMHMMKQHQVTLSICYCSYMLSFCAKIVLKAVTFWPQALWCDLWTADALHGSKNIDRTKALIQHYPGHCCVAKKQHPCCYSLTAVALIGLPLTQKLWQKLPTMAALLSGKFVLMLIVVEKSWYTGPLVPPLSAWHCSLCTDCSAES